MPLEAATISLITMTMSATARLIRIPVKMYGAAEGSTTCQSSRTPRAPNVLAVPSCTGSTLPAARTRGSGRSIRTRVVDKATRLHLVTTDEVDPWRVGSLRSRPLRGCARASGAGVEAEEPDGSPGNATVHGADAVAAVGLLFACIIGWVINPRIRRSPW